MAKGRGSITADELIKQLEADPEWKAADAVRQSDHSAKVAKLRSEIGPSEEGLLPALDEVGVRVESVWTLVNSRRQYFAAIAVLADALRTVRHPTTREGIARALTVKEAIGIAGGAILNALTNDHDGENVRWALANALTVIATDDDAPKIGHLLTLERNQHIAERLRAALSRLNALDRRSPIGD